MSARDSWARLPRCSHGTSTEVKSLSRLPKPMPRVILPPDRKSRVATVLASSAGWRSADSSTEVPSRMRLVAPATAASTVKASRLS